MDHSKHFALTVFEHFLVNREARTTGVIREGQTDVSAFSSLADGWIHSVYSLVFLKSSISTIFLLKTRSSSGNRPI